MAWGAASAPVDGPAKAAVTPPSRRRAPRLGQGPRLRREASVCGLGRGERASRRAGRASASRMRTRERRGGGGAVAGRKGVLGEAHLVTEKGSDGERGPCRTEKGVRAARANTAPGVLASFHGDGEGPGRRKGPVPLGASARPRKDGRAPGVEVFRTMMDIIPDNVVYFDR